MYALNIDVETGRILSVTYAKYAAPNAPIVDTLPDGDITDYLYVSGEFVYNPMPEKETEPPGPTTEERLAEQAQKIAELEEALNMLLSGVTEDA